MPPGDFSALAQDDSAYRALTDFNSEYPVTEPAGRSVGDALNDMNRLGVHALVVTKPQAEGVDQQVVGLITSSDIQHLRSHPAIELYRMFQGTGLTHLLVVEDHGSEAALARGLISRASLAMRLNQTAGSTYPL
jgi:hypothetical protein